MIAAQFDTLVRALGGGAITRRALARILAGTTVAAGLAQVNLNDLEARKRNKKRKKGKRPRENTFGCRNVGVACSSANQCCSGICEGRGGKGKNGKKRKKTCRAHDTSGCQLNQDSCSGTEFTCTTTTGEEGFCHVTTGNAPYCATEGVEFACTKDEDCIPFCGERAACNTCNIPGEAPETFCGGPDGCVLP